ncbi:hypothetical protein F5Y16DRAFT_183021 [Xylariaceae sp. FL0255]|nr:hypothetical protein F5Y16DRAFT_183021 [Xylariaceae sp. FL0255]
MSAIGLDLSKNYSFYTLPLAWFFANLPGFYAKSLASKMYDVAYPRHFAENVQKDEKLSKQVKNKIFRCESAAANGQETVAFYLAAVLAAKHAGVPVESINTWCGVYLATRLAYNFTYIFLQENRSLAPLRSLVWNASVVSWVVLFVKAGNRIFD